MLSAVRLLRLLSQQFVTTRECAEELVVEVVTVGQNHQRRILHCWLQYEPASIESHRQRFARALCVPDHSDPFVAESATRLRLREIAATWFFQNRFADARSANGLFHRRINGV